VNDVFQPVSGALEAFMYPSHHGSAQGSIHGSRRSSLGDRPESTAASVAALNPEDSGYFSKSDKE